MEKGNQSFKMAIQSYLEKKAKEDSLFAVTYAKENKNIDECCDYIIEEARKRGGNVVAISDSEVFGMAIHYYDEDNIKVNRQSGYKVASDDKKERTLSPKTVTSPGTKRKGKKNETSSTQFLLFDEL